MGKEKDLGDDLFELTFQDHVGLFPSQLGDPLKSVEEMLKATIGKRHRAGGYLVGFRKVRFVSKFGSFYRESPFIHVDFCAKLRVFRPQVGGMYQGGIRKGDVFTLHNYPVAITNYNGNSKEDGWILELSSVKDRRGCPVLVGELKTQII